jgi:hypothetical protein
MQPNSSISTDLRTAFQFHLTNGGYSTPPGKAVCALHAAKAELLLRDAIDADVAEIVWEWDEDYNPSDYDENEDEQRRLDNGSLLALGCILNVNGQHIASLWGIVVESSRDPFCRDIEAQLAIEAEDALRQAMQDRIMDLDFL